MAKKKGTCCKSQNGNKRLQIGEDRLSALPDFLIQHILSLVPTINLVKICVLSKWWKNQWTRVPVLQFVSKPGMSADKFSNFIEKTLLLLDDSPNIDKFIVDTTSFSRDNEFPNMDSWIRFAMRKNVKELIVNFNDDMYRYSLPQLFFNMNSLLFVKLKLSNCKFWSNGKVNWKFMKSLHLDYCLVENQTIESILSSSPLLENLELLNSNMIMMTNEVFVIASSSLKTLVIDGVGSDCSSVAISCPNLERLIVSGLVWFSSLELVNLPSSVYATFDIFFEMEGCGVDENDNDDISISHDNIVKLVEQTLEQVEHVEKLEIGRWMMEILSSSKKDGDWIGGLRDSFIHQNIQKNGNGLFLIAKSSSF